MLKIAITGNIASGKSFVLSFFKNQGFKVLSLDDTVDKIYNQKAFKVLINDFFDTDIKSKIAKIVFSDLQKLKKLQELIYPFILKEMLQFLAENKIAVVEAPMLFEYGFQNYFDEIIYVYANKKIRANRLIKRNHFTEEEAKLRINAQITDRKKIKKSTFVIHNNKDLDNLTNECNRIFNQLKDKGFL